MAKVEGPDQPRSWVIAMAACVINTMLSGISRATGIFYVALIDDYGISRLEANMPFTLRNASRNLAGPVVGIIGQRYGVKGVTFGGSLLASLGIVLCSVAPSVLWVTIFWGVLHGLGVAFANTLFQVTINQYFVKYRATASGIALSGACLGSFVFPITLEMFLSNFGLSGSYLLTGGLIMQVIPASLLLTEPPWLPYLQPHSKPTNGKGLNPKLEPIPESEAKTLSVQGEFREIDGGLSTRNSISNPELQKHISNARILGKKKSSSAAFENPTFTGSLEDVNEKVKDRTMESSLSRRRSRTISASEVSITIPIENLEKSALQHQPLWKCICQVYRNPMFHIISISFGTFGLLFDPLMTVIVDYVKDKGLDDHVGKYLISILSLGDLAGRMCFGWVTDKGYMSLPKFICLSQVLQGISFVLLPSFYTFEALMGAAILFGVGAGTSIIMFPILIAKYLTNEQALAIGCMAFFGGIMSFASPPLIGHFRDHVGSYDGMFYITGILSLAVGLLWLLEPCVAKPEADKSQNVEAASESR